MSKSAHVSQLAARIENRTATVAVVGLGYVGLPLVRAIFETGFRVIGFDIDATKIDKLTRGESYIKHLGDELFTQLADSDRFLPTRNPEDLAEADVILLCVPTPLGEHREPDLSFVLDSTALVGQTLRPGQLVILESTTYPGTTSEQMRPILEQSFRCGEDFFLAYSPEREDPGTKGATVELIPKVVGGVDEPSTDLAVLFYQQFVGHVHRVSSAEAAEASKLLENIYRAVNIALVNELKVLFGEMDIDVWEVIEAASTKPFGFHPFYPGPGLGGHCIPIDPFYLAWKARTLGRTTKFIELAGEINAHMPEYVINRVISALNESGTALRGANVLVVGIAYKPNIDDMRETPAAEIISRLQTAGANVSYHDPHLPSFSPMRQYSIELDSVKLDEAALTAADCVLIVTNHDAIDYDLIGRHARLVVDTRNAMSAVADPAARIIKA